MRLKILIFILLIFTIKAASAQVVWEDHGEVTLYLGDKFNIDPYTIVASDFDRDSFLINIYKYDKIIDSSILKTSEDFNYNDEIKINKSMVFPGANGFSKFHLWKRAAPDFVISFTTEKDTYSPGSYIPVTININNNGNLTARNISTNLDIGEMELITGVSEKYYDTIAAKTTVSFSVTVATPRYPKKSTFTLIAMASGYDENNTNFKGYGSKSLTILSSIYLEKTIDGRKIDNVPYVYWDAPGNVSIKVINTGNSDVKGLKLEDGITEDFEPVALSFPDFDLQKGEQKIIKYPLTPKKPGRYTLPKANVSFILNNEKVKLESEKQDLIVGGAYIQLTKSHEILDDKGLIQVIVTAQNIGDVRASTLISDSIDPNIKPLGNVSLVRNITLEPGEKEIISYIASIPAKVDLPPAKASFNKLNIETNKISIALPGSNTDTKVNEEKKQELPVELSYFPTAAVSALFGWALIATLKNGRYNVSLTIERTGERKIISTSLGMVVVILSLSLLVISTMFITQNMIKDKYMIFIMYLLIFGSILRYIESKKTI